MTIAEILLQDYDIEVSNTRRTIERVPEGKPDWAPHEKSMKMGKLAMHCATLPLFGYYILEDEGMDMANSKRPQSDLTFSTREACLKAAGRIFRQVPCRPRQRQRRASFRTVEVQLRRARDLPKPPIHDVSRDVFRPHGAPYSTIRRLSQAQ